MNFVALVLAAAVTTAQLGSLRDSSAVVTGVDAGAFLASSNNVVAAGKTNTLFSGSGVVKASGVTLAVEGGGVSLSPSTSVSAVGPVYFPTNAMPDSGAAGWESLDQRMARRLFGAFYYDVDSDGNPTAVTLGSRYLPATYPVGPFSFAFDGSAAGGSRSFAGGNQSRATAFGAFAYGSATLASAEGAVAMGSHAEATNQYSFVWQGYAPGVVPFGSSAYGSHGDGSFSVWPKDGVSGFWIGSQTLAQYVTSRTSAFVDPSQEFTYRSALGDEGVRFTTAGGHNRVEFSSGTALSMQGGSTLGVADGAAVSIADPADVTVAGTPLPAWVAAQASRASDDSVKALIESETGGTNGVKAAADLASLNATAWTGVGLAAGITLRRDPLADVWTDGAQSIRWTGSGWAYSSNVVETTASGSLSDPYVKFAMLSTDGDFAFERAADVRGDLLRASDTNALADAISPLLSIDGAPSNTVLLVFVGTNAYGAVYRLQTKDGLMDAPVIPSSSGKFVTQPGCTTDYLADGDYSGGTRVIASSISPENSYTAYAYNGVSVKRDGGATKNYTYDETSSGIARRGDVDEVKAKFYDEPLEVEWTFKAVNGEFMMIATTNVNTGVLAP